MISHIQHEIENVFFMDAISFSWPCVLMITKVDIHSPKFSMGQTVKNFPLVLMEFHHYIFIFDISFSKRGMKPKTKLITLIENVDFV